MGEDCRKVVSLFKGGDGPLLKSSDPGGHGSAGGKAAKEKPPAAPKHNRGLMRTRRPAGAFPPVPWLIDRHPTVAPPSGFLPWRFRFYFSHAAGPRGRPLSGRARTSLRPTMAAAARPRWARRKSGRWPCWPSRPVGACWRRRRGGGPGPRRIVWPGPGLMPRAARGMENSYDPSPPEASCTWSLTSSTRSNRIVRRGELNGTGSPAARGRPGGRGPRPSGPSPSLPAAARRRPRAARGRGRRRGRRRSSGPGRRRS